VNLCSCCPQDLGVAFTGNDAESLKVLVSSAAKRKADQAILFDNFLDHFLNAELTDCEIRVRHPVDGASHSDASKGEAFLESIPEERVLVRSIKAHSLLLSSRANYFRKLLLGNWSESSDKTVTIDVEDEQGE
jgi:hypothetical protein